MASLLQLPSELLEHRVCQYLDVKSIKQLSLVNRQLQNDVTLCSELWVVLVARHFGYVNNAPLTRRARSASDDTEQAAMTTMRWKTVFVAAWNDALALAAASLQESDVLQVYHFKFYPTQLHPQEDQVRQEIVLMQGLRRLPTSVKLIHLYAEVIRQAHFVPRVGAASTAAALRKLAL